jgi:hypothetical protein
VALTHLHEGFLSRLHTRTMLEGHQQHGGKHLVLGAPSKAVPGLPTVLLAPCQHRCVRSRRGCRGPRKGCDAWPPAAPHTLKSQCFQGGKPTNTRLTSLEKWSSPIAPDGHRSLAGCARWHVSSAPPHVMCRPPVPTWQVALRCAVLRPLDVPPAVLHGDLGAPGDLQGNHEEGL